MKQFLKALALASTLLGLNSAANAQDNTVVLRSFDQNFEVTGELLGFDDEFFNIRTAIGDLNVGREFVDCSGPGCPGAAVAAVAEDDGTVTLAADDGTEFTGTLLDFDGSNYILQTSIGVLTIRGEFVQCSGLSCPGNIIETENLMVVLTSGDGNSFEGDLVEYDGTNYILETSLGLLTIRGEFVQCSGDACPDTGPQVATFNVAAPAGVGELFINDALNRFTDEKSQNITRSIGDTEIHYLIGDQSGNQLADITILPANDVASIRALFSYEAAFALTREAFTAEDIASVTNMEVQEITDVLDFQIIALDALVPQLHISNPLRSLSIDQIASILAGNTTNWSQVGGADLPITVHFLDDSSNLARMVNRDVLAPRGFRLGTSAVLHDNREDMSLAIADDPSSFTLSFRSDTHHGVENPAFDLKYSESSNAALLASQLSTSPDVHGVRIIGIRDSSNNFSSAHAFSMQTEEYPLTQRWFLYSLANNDNADYANTFAAYLSSDEGQNAAETAGLIGLAITVQPLANQGERLLSTVLSGTVNGAALRTYQSYIAEVSTGYRLSATMRFLTGTSDLDARSKRDWQRVAQLISGGLMNENNLVLVGFTDSVGGFSANVNLSRSRAEFVKSIILQENAGVLFSEDISVLGFGPVAAVGPNATADGRRLNRRVEIWIRGKNEVPLR